MHPDPQEWQVAAAWTTLRNLTARHLRREPLMFEVLVLPVAAERAPLQRNRPVPRIVLLGGFRMNPAHDLVAALRAEHVGAVVLANHRAKGSVAAGCGGKLFSASAASLRHHLRSVDDKMRDHVSVRV